MKDGDERRLLATKHTYSERIVTENTTGGY